MLYTEDEPADDTPNGRKKKRSVIICTSPIVIFHAGLLFAMVTLVLLLPIIQMIREWFR